MTWKTGSLVAALTIIGMGIMNDRAAADAPPLASTAEDHPGYSLSEWNEKERLPPLLEGIDTPAQWEAKAQRIRSKWIDYIGGLPDRVPLNLEIIAETQQEDHLRQKLEYDTVYGDRVTAYLLIPNEALDNDRRYPAILALHPTNALGKDSVATEAGQTTKYRAYGLDLVSRGYIVLAPDAMTSGERIFPESEAAYPDNAHFRTDPFYEQYPQWSAIAKHLVDNIQAMDLLSQHERVDPGRIGAVGHSFGAYSAYFLAGVDDRVAAFVASCGFSPLIGGLERHWALRDPPRYLHLPTLDADLDRDHIPFEFHEIAALAAPTPGFYYNGQHDHIFPQWRAIAEGMDQLHHLYVLLDAEDHFVSILSSGGHDYPKPIRDMSYDFLDHWLKRDAR